MSYNQTSKQADKVLISNSPINIKHSNCQGRIQGGARGLCPHTYKEGGVAPPLELRVVTLFKPETEERRV